MITVKQSDLPEGIFLNRYFENRMIRRNQNILLAVTGGTGSGKSYTCLRIAELWYQYKFGEPFPSQHVCFTIEEVMRVLSQKEKKLRKGDLIILEEAGVNMGSLDFQNKVSKMFGYVLQSFRSMNVGIIMNLPVLTMLNKSARLLLHCHMITAGIDYEKKVTKVKPFFNQLNQQSGKIYPKYMRASVAGKKQKIQRFNYKLASEEIINKYEIKKLKFVSELNEDFLNKLEAEQRAESIKMARDDLTEKQREVYELWITGITAREIGERLERKESSVADSIRGLKKKGYERKIRKNAKKIGILRE